MHAFPFGHADDIRLDVPSRCIAGHLGPAVSLLRSVLQEAFGSLVIRTIEGESRLLRVARDLYDRSRKVRQTVLFFIRDLAWLRDVANRVFRAYGSHDAQSKLVRRLALLGYVIEFPRGTRERVLLVGFGAVIHGQRSSRPAVRGSIAVGYPAPRQACPTLASSPPSLPMRRARRTRSSARSNSPTRRDCTVGSLAMSKNTASSAEPRTSPVCVPRRYTESAKSDRMAPRSYWFRTALYQVSNCPRSASGPVVPLVNPPEPLRRAVPTALADRNPESPSLASALFGIPMDRERRPPSLPASIPRVELACRRRRQNERMMMRTRCVRMEGGELPEGTEGSSSESEGALANIAALAHRRQGGDHR